MFLIYARPYVIARNKSCSALFKLTRSVLCDYVKREKHLDGHLLAENQRPTDSRRTRRKSSMNTQSKSRLISCHDVRIDGKRLVWSTDLQRALQQAQVEANLAQLRGL